MDKISSSNGATNAQASVGYDTTAPEEKARSGNSTPTSPTSSFERISTPTSPTNDAATMLLKKPEASLDKGKKRAASPQEHKKPGLTIRTDASTSTLETLSSADSAPPTPPANKGDKTLEEHVDGVYQAFHTCLQAVAGLAQHLGQLASSAWASSRLWLSVGLHSVRQACTGMFTAGKAMLASCLDWVKNNTAPAEGNAPEPSANTFASFKARFKATCHSWATGLSSKLGDSPAA